MTKFTNIFFLAFCPWVILCPQATFADSEERWVNPQTQAEPLRRHFGVMESNCYALTPRTGDPELAIQLTQHIDPDVDRVGEVFELVHIDLTAISQGETYAATGHCVPEDTLLECAVDCDSGGFDFYDAGYDQVIVRIRALGSQCDGGKGGYFDQTLHGSVFLLDRMDDATCETLLQE